MSEHESWRWLGHRPTSPHEHALFTSCLGDQNQYFRKWRYRKAIETRLGRRLRHSSSPSATFRSAGHRYSLDAHDLLSKKVLESLDENGVCTRIHSDIGEVGTTVRPACLRARHAGRIDADGGTRWGVAIAVADCGRDDAGASESPSPIPRPVPRIRTSSSRYGVRRRIVSGC
jgi:hypothetical protein